MDWNKFKNKFHTSWHKYIQSFVESEQCDKIYTFLKSRKGIEIAPKSNLTFRAFEMPLQDVKVIVMFNEPYSDKYNDLQYADGIGLSCEYVEKLHPYLNAWHNAMEKEFYDLNLNMIKDLDLKFLKHQGILFLNSDLTVEINIPGSHKGLWKDFNRFIFKEIVKKRKIPIVFCGKEIAEQYIDLFDEDYPYFIINQSISECKIGIEWNTENKFTELNSYMWEKTSEMDIMWVHMDVPF